MTTATRNLLISGAALTSAAAIMVAAPAVVPGQVAGVPTPLKLSSAQFELTALTDITLQGINDALVTGFGGAIGASDPFYPGLFSNDAKVTGIAGAAYYLIDNTVGPLIPFHLAKYFFEVGSTSSNQILGGLGAVAYVGVGSIFGANSAPAQIVKTLVGGGSFDLGAAVLQLTSGIPVVGDLTSIYFTGTSVGGTTDYGTGIAGVLAYANAMLPGLAQYGGVSGVISAVTGFIGGLFGGRGGHGSGSESESHSTDSSETETESESEHQSNQWNQSNHHHYNSQAAASVASVAAKAVAAAPVAAATANAATAVQSGSSKAAESKAADAATETPEAPSSTDAVADTGSDNAASDTTAAAPKRAATRGQQSQSTDKAAGHDSKRVRVSRAG